MMMMEKETWRYFHGFPQDIHMEILSWISAKSLTSSFKLVCKAWHNLIHHPDFIKKHLNRGGAINGERSSKSLLRKPGNVLYQLHPPFNRDYCPPLDLVHSSYAGATQLDLNFDIDFGYSTLVGSWNGILCLRNNYHVNIILLNPCTRKYKVSPKQLIQCISQFTSYGISTITYGFGCYNNNNNTITTEDDEYKVVRIANFYPYDNRPSEFQIDIYSMSSNSWRRLKGGVEDIPLEQMHDTRFGVFLNGYVHWIGCKRRHSHDWDMIVSFNIREEEFDQIPMPPVVKKIDEYGCRRYISSFVSLMNVRGCLGNVYVSSGTEMMDIELEIWVMKEYGIKESWTKEFLIRSDSNSPWGLSNYAIDEFKSMTCTLAGDQIIFEERLSFIRRLTSRDYKWKRYGKRVLYDINKKKIDGDVILEVDDFYLKQEQVDYIETLVSLKSSLQLPLSNNRKRKNCS